MSHINIDAKNLFFEYEPGTPVLKDVSFHIAEGEAVGLVGPNGAGKSTLLRLLVGLETGYKGTLRVVGIPVEKGTLAEVRRRIGYVFQDAESQLFMPTVGDDVAFGPSNYGLSSQEVEFRVQTALAKTGISHLKDRPIYKLSGGEKKLASIATILSMDPDIICMDEPSVGLDPANRENLINILKSFPHMKLISSHDLDFVDRVCDRKIRLEEGRIV